MGSFAPYGYMKDPNDKHKLIIDENVAPIVREISKHCCDCIWSPYSSSIIIKITTYKITSNRFLNVEEYL